MADIGFRSKGRNVTVSPFARIISPGTISIGNSVRIDDFAFLMGGKSTKIGSHVHIAPHVTLTGGGELVLEDFVGLSIGSVVLTGTDDFLGEGLTGPTVPPKYRAVIRGRVVIGKHSVIGANSVVLSGVTIGEGVAVGANSLVAKDCKAWTVYAGSPARPLGKRPRAKILALERALREEEGH